MVRPVLLVCSLWALVAGGCVSTSRSAADRGRWDRARLDVALQLANEHIAAGKLDRAQALLASFSTDPESKGTSEETVRLQTARARIAIEQGQYAAALERLAPLTSSAALMPSLHHLRGVASEGLGRWSEAAGSYRRAYELEPTAERLIGWLDTLVLDGGGDEACDILERERRGFPGNAALHVAAARLYARQGGAQNAVSELRTAVLLEPDAPALRESLARTHMSAGDYQEAVSIWRELVAATRDDEEKLRHFRRRLADALVGAERYAEAAEVYRTLTMVRSDDADACVGLATVELARGRPTEALRAAQQALRADPEHVEARLVAALSYARMERPADAVNMLNGIPAEQRGLPLVREMQRRRSASAPAE